MSVDNAEFLIQRSGSQYTCEGSDLYSKIQATDLFAIYRSGTLYRGTKDKIQDADYLVCMDGSVTKKVLGSLVKPLLDPPSPLSGTGNATLTGTFQVGFTLSVGTIPTFTGGVSPVVYEYQYQKSAGTGAWQGFDGPWAQYDPDNLPTVPTLLLPAVTENQYIRLQVRATDNDGTRVIRAGDAYGPIAPA